MVTLEIIQSLSLSYILTKWDTITIVTRYFLEFWKQMLLIMQKKKDFFFNHKIWHFLSFLEILIGIWLICLHIVKISDPKIIFMLQGFLIFALHSMRNTQVRKNMKKFINSISSVFSVR